MLKVQSSWVDSIAYVCGNLQVKTTEDRNYIYLGVPKRVFSGLLKAKSQGSYLNKKIINKYECVALFPTDG